MSNVDMADLNKSIKQRVAEGREARGLVDAEASAISKEAQCDGVGADPDAPFCRVFS
jgi:hypothetical protein